MKDLNLIELTDLEKRYGKKEALTGINLTIGRGKIIGLLGPNGSGKTTFDQVIKRSVAANHQVRLKSMVKHLVLTARRSSAICQIRCILQIG